MLSTLTNKFASFASEFCFKKYISTEITTRTTTGATNAKVLTLSTLVLIRVASYMVESGYYFRKGTFDVKKRSKKQQKAFKKALRLSLKAGTAKPSTKASAKPTTDLSTKTTTEPTTETPTAIVVSEILPHAAVTDESADETLDACNDGKATISTHAAMRLLPLKRSLLQQMLSLRPQKVSLLLPLALTVKLLPLNLQFLWLLSQQVLLPLRLPSQSDHCTATAPADTGSIMKATINAILNSLTLLHIALIMIILGYFLENDAKNNEPETAAKTMELTSSMTGSIAIEIAEVTNNSSTSAAAPVDTTGIFTATGIITVTSSSTLSSLTLANIALKMKDLGYYFGSDATDVKKRSSKEQEEFESNERLEAQARRAEFLSKRSFSTNADLQNDTESSAIETGESSNFEHYISYSDSSSSSEIAMQINHNSDPANITNSGRHESECLETKAFNGLQRNNETRKSKLRSKSAHSCFIEHSDFEERHPEGYGCETTPSTYYSSLTNLEDMFPSNIRYGVYTIYAEEERLETIGLLQDETETRQAKMNDDWCTRTRGKSEFIQDDSNAVHMKHLDKVADGLNVSDSYVELPEVIMSHMST